MKIINGNEPYTVARFASEAAVNWDAVDRAAIAVYGWNSAASYNAYARMVYVTGYGFLVKLNCEQENPVRRFTENDDPVYQDDAMEVFLAFSPAGYINCETNSLGARLQAFGPNRDERYSVFSKFPEGFPIEAGREGKEWTLLLRLPIADLRRFFTDLTEEALVPGYRFTGNFYKIREADKREDSHFGMWKEIVWPVDDFHRPEQFGTLIMGE